MGISVCMNRSKQNYALYNNMDNMNSGDNFCPFFSYLKLQGAKTLNNFLCQVDYFGFDGFLLTKLPD